MMIPYIQHLLLKTVLQHFEVKPPLYIHKLLQTRLIVYIPYNGRSFFLAPISSVLLSFLNLASPYPIFSPFQHQNAFQKKSLSSIEYP